MQLLPGLESNRNSLESSSQTHSTLTITQENLYLGSFCSVETQTIEIRKNSTKIREPYPITHVPKW